MTSQLIQEDSRFYSFAWTASLMDSEESDKSENELLKSNLWMTIFKSGFNESTEVTRFEIRFNSIKNPSVNSI